MKKHAKQLMLGLQDIPENDLTRDVIIPLLEKLGYERVEFFGGTNEEGKDILCWEKNKVGNIELTVAQVKHFKLTNTASDKNSLQTIINQLTACLVKSLLNTENKLSYLPTKVFLISSYPIDVKTMQTRFSNYPDLSNNKIEIIDGIKLSELLIQENQPIVESILGNRMDFTNHIIESLNNKVLLKALGFHENIKLHNIYTDIDFSLGRNSTKIFFNSEFEGKNQIVEIEEDSWMNFKQDALKLEKYFSLNYILPPIEKIETNYNEEKEKYLGWESNLEILQKEATTMKKDIELLEKKFKEYEKVRSELRVSLKNLGHNDKISRTERKKQQEEYRAELKKIDTIEKPIFEEKKKLAKLARKIDVMYDEKPDPKYSFRINGTELASLLKNKRENILFKVDIFNNEKPNKIELKGFVIECKEILYNIDNFIKHRYIYESIFSDIPKINFRLENIKTRFKLSINDILDTKENILILGEAGAGKTTSLQMYAYNNMDTQDCFIIWSPLSYVIQNWSNNKKEIRKFKKIENFDTAIFEYLNSKEINILHEKLREIFIEKETIILLDGLDEAIKNNPWLPEGIMNLNKKYPKAQLIVTSRMSGEYINEIPFFTVTLLPFTNEQRDEFISKWFQSEDNEPVAEIKEHLKKNKSISDITRTPLLTTALCVLAKNKVPLPQTEIKLYEDRLDLLTGYYDNVKNIETRITSTHSNLKILAQKLAFYMHYENIREMEFEIMKQISMNLMRNVLSNEQSTILFNELIEPCNIIVPMTSDGKYGFGHLRYQEHLAATEIKSNRSIDIAKLISNEWWKDCLILFAQMSENIEWLISSLNFKLKIEIIRNTVDLMVNIRPYEERKILQRNIQRIVEESDELSFENYHLDEI